MSVTSRNPLRMAGAAVNSGNVNTGEVGFTTGGGQVYSAGLSGITVDTLIFSGAGRLNNISVLTNLVSGRAVVFYDGAVATSGGPFALSGHKVLATIPTGWRESGYVNTLSQAGSVLPVQMPFQSGLIAANQASGAVGWSVSFTPETNQQFN